MTAVAEPSHRVPLMRPTMDEREADAAGRAVRSGWVTQGPEVAAFEAEFASYVGADHAVAVSNCTAALHLALLAAGVGPGHEVITVSHSYIATANAIVYCGATPVFVDVDPATLLVTAEAIAGAITPSTRAVMVVHLYGQVPDMDAIANVTEAAGIHIIEDAAQAHGATFRGRRAGSFGTAATFSFYPGKNLGALGDGGAVVTDDESLATEIRTLANHGRGSHLLHTHRGRNSRLDGLQAAALSIKLTKLDMWNDQRRAAHARYVERLAGSVQMLTTLDGGNPVHHLEVIRVDDRDGMRDALGERGIQTGIHYALPCHKHPAFAEFDVAPLPIAEVSAARQFSLPMHPTLTMTEVDAVADAVLELL